MIGILKHRVTLDHPAATPDGEGGETISWQTFATVWAAVDPRPAQETAQDGQIRARVRYAVTIRYRDDISVSDRVQYSGTSLDIVSVTHKDAAKVWTVLECVEV